MVLAGSGAEGRLNQRPGPTLSVTRPRRVSDPLLIQIYRNAVYWTVKHNRDGLHQVWLGARRRRRSRMTLRGLKDATAPTTTTNKIPPPNKNFQSTHSASLGKNSKPISLVCRRLPPLLRYIFVHSCPSYLHHAPFRSLYLIPPLGTQFRSLNPKPETPNPKL